MCTHVSCTSCKPGVHNQYSLFNFPAKSERANLYLKLFKLVFGSVSLFAQENEQMLKVNIILSFPRIMPPCYKFSVCRQKICPVEIQNLDSHFSWNLVATLIPNLTYDLVNLSCNFSFEIFYNIFILYLASSPRHSQQLDGISLDCQRTIQLLLAAESLIQIYRWR